MKETLKGFLFSLGFIPVVILSIWLFHNWPLVAPGFDSGADFAFDKSQLQFGEIKLTRSDNGIRGLGEVTNRSDKPCGFVQIECDLLNNGKVIAHEIAVVSSLLPRTTRGYTFFFSGVPDEIDVATLKAQVSLAQAFNIDVE